MRKMTVKQARKVRDALMIGGTIIVLLAYFWKPFVCVGVIVGLSGLIPLSLIPSPTLFSFL